MTKFFRAVKARAFGFESGPMSIREGDVFAETDVHYVMFPKDCFVFDHVDKVEVVEPVVIEEVLEEPVVYEVKKEAIVKKPRKPRKAVV